MRFLTSLLIVSLAWLSLNNDTKSYSDDCLYQTVLVANRDISSGTVLSGNEFDLIEIPIGLVASSDISLKEIKGKTLAYPLVKGELIFAKDMFEKSDESQVFVAMETDAFSLKKGDKVAVMASNEKNSITLLDNLNVVDIKENQYDNKKTVILAAKEEEAQALNLLKYKSDLNVVPSSGGLKASENPLKAAKALIAESVKSPKRVQVIEGGDVTWYDLD